MRVEVSKMVTRVAVEVAVEASKFIEDPHFLFNTSASRFILESISFLNMSSQAIVVSSGFLKVYSARANRMIGEKVRECLGVIQFVDATGAKLDVSSTLVRDCKTMLRKGYDAIFSPEVCCGSSASGPLVCSGTRQAPGTSCLVLGSDVSHCISHDAAMAFDPLLYVSDMKFKVFYRPDTGTPGEGSISSFTLAPSGAVEVTVKWQDNALSIMPLNLLRRYLANPYLGSLSGSGSLSGLAPPAPPAAPVAVAHVPATPVAQPPVTPGGIVLPPAVSAIAVTPHVALPISVAPVVPLAPVGPPLVAVAAPPPPAVAMLTVE